MVDLDLGESHGKNGWVNLTEATTMQVEAYAKELVDVNTLDHLVKTIERLTQKGQDFFVLGEGSNTIFANDFDGTVIRIAIKGIELIEDSSKSVLVKVSAGENWHQFVRKCVSEQWNGLENLALIPGTVGAAPIQNIGAYGVEVQSHIEAVEVLDIDTLAIEEVAAQDCGFAYRDSRFKRDWSDKKIVTAVYFRLFRENKVVFDYPALKAVIEEAKVRTANSTSVKPSQIFDAVVAIRLSKLPDPNKTPNAGSFFKNPIVDADKHAQLKVEHIDLVSYPHENEFKLAAAWLIERAGWKHREIDGVKVHQSQALVIINPDRKSGSQVKAFAEKIQEDIFAKFGVKLEVEPVLL